MNKTLNRMKHAWEPRKHRYEGATPKGLKTIMMEEEAISPVIATILLIAITVALIGGLYVLIGHFTSSTSAPLSATITEQNEGTNYAVMEISFTTPSNMTNLAGITLSLQVPAVGGGTPTLIAFGALNTTPITISAKPISGSVFAVSSDKQFVVSITNINVGDTTGIQSGAIITLYYGAYAGNSFTPSGTSYSWSGVVFQLNYKGYSGTASITLP